MWFFLFTVNCQYKKILILLSVFFCKIQYGYCSFLRKLTSIKSCGKYYKVLHSWHYWWYKMANMACTIFCQLKTVTLKACYWNKVISPRLKKKTFSSKGSNSDLHYKITSPLSPFFSKHWKLSPLKVLFPTTKNTQKLARKNSLHTKKRQQNTTL